MPARHTLEVPFSFANVVLSLSRVYVPWKSFRWRISVEDPFGGFGSVYDLRNDDHRLLELYGTVSLEQPQCCAKRSMILYVNGLSNWRLRSAVALASHTRLLPGKARQLASAILCEWLIIAALHVC